VEYKVNPHLQLAGGEMLVPNSRQGLQSTLSYYTVNISAVSTVANSALSESALRDVGFQARGYFLDDRLQYRGGIFGGTRDPDGRNAPRPALYLQYDFFDREKEYAYAGTALGKRKILAVDVGGDKQGAYRSETVNVANDTPVNGGDEVGLNVSVLHFDGRNKFIAIPDQNNYLLEGAYYFHKAKLQPFAKFETQDFVAAVNGTKDQPLWRRRQLLHPRPEPEMDVPVYAGLAAERLDYPPEQRIDHAIAGILFLTPDAAVRPRSAIAHDSWQWRIGSRLGVSQAEKCQRGFQWLFTPIIQ